ncbi:unnamed protein product [Rotaria magnacalcarata]|uniref:Uncharacterized protein n=2 Tax=Rotaria magnacalcarata TaxID=392030 RepID=A0A816XWM8_9BILA|nr:unnamed protein product [Rotaria magnacalcarata]CAF4530326.1 unnamed protein product [Rotaria magnacalcarata]CAF4589271.1 unnamed protein product [Rotaria magnacalcarata]
MLSSPPGCLRTVRTQAAIVKAIHRNIAAYKNDESIREQCRGLMALSLMSVSEIEPQFKHIRALFLPSYNELFVYFERQRIKGNILLSLWNASESDHRTNNISEVYNRRFGTRIINKHQNIWTFIRLIQDEHAIFERINIQVAYGAEMSKSNSALTFFFSLELERSWIEIFQLVGRVGVCDCFSIPI